MAAFWRVRRYSRRQFLAGSGAALGLWLTGCAPASPSRPEPTRAAE
jgi:hypothetical protein